MPMQFAPFTSLVQPEFWHELTRRKVDELRLSQDALQISASYTIARSVRDRESGTDIALPANLALGGDAFDADAKPPPHAVLARGVFRNFNTIEDFKALDKTATFNEVASEIWTKAIENNDPSELTRFILISFADLKKYRYYYWFGFPAFAAKPAWEIDAAGWTPAQQTLGAPLLSAVSQSLQSSPLPAFFLVRKTASGADLAPVKDYTSFFANVPENERIVGFVDPSSAPENPGWPLRNLLTFLRARDPNASSFRILCWRDAEPPVASRSWKSTFGVLSGPPSSEQPSAVGWEKTAQGKLAPRLADLGPLMDPVRLADQAVDLNLKLMRWRILPALDLEKVSQTRVLLLGAGTLGCYVARSLLGWGVRTITLVDSARVSFSNPVRQPLFEFADCLDGGKPKAQAAADALKRIFPNVKAEGHALNIPMPGHPVAQGEEERVKRDVETLEKLFDEHDAVYLLMDSRESRWLPTLLGAAKARYIVLNAALGFDTYLVMRHGAPGGPNPSERLGCYFCYDVVAPADSLTDRTLDQMCTVTRPGLAAIASASAVELLASLLQHPSGVHAPPPPIKQAEDGVLPEGTEGVLGLVPHQLRGFLAQFRTLPIVGKAFSRCTACSDYVVNAYKKDGWPVLLHAFNERDYLEKLTGLDELQRESEAALESLDWDEDEGAEGADDF
ncbi:E1-like protein-activating [Auriculariales sp. MPI-PUGE-AT-0066]|nr:E1-like protein-activating [Auriculariales sp. MPI-PUGE-AT-0066]